MRAGALLRRVRSVTLHEYRDLLEAQLMLIVAALELKLRRRGDVIEKSAVPATSSLRPGAVAQRAAWAVDRAARYGVIRPLCLTRAIALRRMLRARGIEADVRVGVLRRDGRFEAHAWVVSGGVVFDSAPGAAAECAAFDGVRVKAGA